MPGDYPDYTSLLQIIGSDIMVPIDLQGAYIMMPVDLQAQYITLEIDIVAQTVGDITVDIAAQTIGNLAVNIAASAITLNVAIASSAVTFNVDITTQTLTTLKIDIKAQSVAIIDQPNWAAINATDKNFILASGGLAWSANAYGTYTVPANKTLYLCGMAFTSYAGSAADADSNQMGMIFLFNVTDSVNLPCLGGNGGGSVVFSKPIKVAANKQLKYAVYNWANHNVIMWASVWGYEL